MIFKNAEIYGVSEAFYDSDGAAGFLRVPSYVDEHLERGKNQNMVSTGVEIRFVLNSGDATIVIKNSALGQIQTAVVYYGDFVADWPETQKIITDEYTEIKIVASPNIEILREIAQKHNHRFSPDVIRIFCEDEIRIKDIRGDISIPTPELLPKQKYLAYGSSITHGSISLARPYQYSWQVGEFFGADVQNLGFAGSACLEREMADYIANDCEFDFATLEMGVNILDIDPQDYEGRVRYFLNTIAKAHPKSKIFAIDVFYCGSDVLNDGKAAMFRKILRSVVDELSFENVVYVNGLSVLGDGKYLSSGLTHPGPRAIEQMSQNLIKIISNA